MTVGRARTVAVVGLAPVAVTVEAHVGAGLPGLQVIGSSGTAGRQAAERVRTALVAIGSAVGGRKILVSLAPADVPKAGARFDLAMAVAILAALGELPEDALGDVVLLGELALDGGVRAVPGVLPAVGSLPGAGCRRAIVADANAVEAGLVGRVEVVPVTDLAEVVAVLRGEQPGRRADAAAAVPGACGAGRGQGMASDLADVRGQAEARRALEIAAAGGHHLLLLGPPGCGKSMLARRLPGILPPLNTDEALELAAVRSVAGALVDGTVLDRTPPLRAPHHTVSAAGLLGGGTGVARPGELSLAHHGVLFMDELFEWPRGVLEALREPLEEGVVRVARSRATVVYPARVQLVAAANPCPCGGGRGCTCGEDAVWAYRTKLSGPLADRLDLAPAVWPLRSDDLLPGGGAEPSAAVAGRVRTARALAADRWGGALTNAAAPALAVRRSARPSAVRALADAVEAGRLTGRGFDRALRVARTCADLDGASAIGDDHVFEAAAHRRNLQAAAGRVAAAAS